MKLRDLLKRLSINWNTKEYISSGIIESYILGLASPLRRQVFWSVL